MKRAVIKIATMPHADNFQIHLFAALAQQEREFIAGRTKDALAALKRKASKGDVDATQSIRTGLKPLQEVVQRLTGQRLQSPFKSA